MAQVGRWSAKRRAATPLKYAADEVVALYLAGKSSTQIGKRFGVAPATILRALHDRGIVVRSKHESTSLVKRGKKGISSHGYVRVNVGRRQRQYEHILIAERVLGRKLRANERVHHINGDGSDNRDENLLICTHDYHLALHARMRAHPYWAQFTST